jgi:hypothetical protein
MRKELVTVFTWDFLSGVRCRITNLIGVNGLINQLLYRTNSCCRMPAEPDLYIVDMIEVIGLKAAPLHRARKVGTKMMSQQIKTVC